MSQIDFSEYLDKKYEGVAIVPGRPSITTNAAFDLVTIKRLESIVELFTVKF